MSVNNAKVIYNSRTADKFVVRLPKGVRGTIQDRAKTHGRSMNSEIVLMLETHLKKQQENNGWIPCIGQAVIYQSEVWVIKNFCTKSGEFHAIIEIKEPLLMSETSVKVNELKPLVVGE